MPYKFTDDDKVSSNWWKKRKIGDTIQGTLVSKQQRMNQLSDQNQWIYEIKTVDEEYWNVGGTLGIDAQMRNISLGQIVEFRYIEERPSKKPGMSAAKIVQVFSSKNAVDEKWLQENEAAMHAEEISEGEASGEEKGLPIDEALEKGFGNDKEAKINALAKTKLKVTDEAKIKEAVMEKTELAFIVSNYDAIIEKLETM